MLELKNLTKVYGDLVAVDSVSLEIYNEELFALIGPSGCGKTTTLRMISGLEQPTNGKVLWRGEDITDLSPAKRDSQLVFQNLALFPHKTVKENIAYGLEMEGVEGEEKEKRVMDMIETVGLTGHENKKPNQLSGGEQQRVAFGRGLVTEPSLLLLDEPLGSLDRNLRLEMAGEVKRLQEKSGSSFIYVTHNQELAMSMADRMAVMRDGKIEQVGTPEEIYNRPVNLFVNNFVGDSNLLKGEVISQNKVKTESIEMTALAAENVESKEVTISLRPSDISIVAEEKTTLENIFEGKINNFLFTGNIVTYEVEIDGHTLEVESSPKRSEGILKKGKKVRVGWSEKAPNIFAR